MARTAKKAMDDAAPPRARGQSCVYVVGMHRSGTSAVAGMLGRLGLCVPWGDDLIPATATNAGGHWESKQLVGLNHRLLARHGGTWSAPPDLSAGWEFDPGLDDLAREAAALFESSLGSRPAAWKDPRLCVVLPFWQRVVRPPTAAVFVYREPLEVAASLTARNGFQRLHGCAYAERCPRAEARCRAEAPALRFVAPDQQAACHFA